ncbi:sugar kinase [Pantoea sp.]|uniref:sugar kinase n=1 Tax=Pantoea sp. TaxID=69393 RepID=UPI0031D38723
MIKIACVGIAVLDRLYFLPRLPNEGGKYEAQRYQECGGGPAATAAVTIARLGAQVDFIGRVGDDAAGETLIAELQSWGVNTQFCRKVVNAESTHSTILVDEQGERMIVNYPSKDLPADADWLKAIDFTQYDLVLGDVRWHQGTHAAFSQAARAGVPTLLDGDVTTQDITDLVASSTHAVFSTPGLARFAATEFADAGLAFADAIAPGIVYVTQGSDGIKWREDDRLCHISAFKTDVVDTTGAGDVFHGALALALAEGQAKLDAIRFASAVAALKCTQPGGRAGIPDRQQTRTFLSQFE